LTDRLTNKADQSTDLKRVAHNDYRALRNKSDEANQESKIELIIQCTKS